MAITLQFQHSKDGNIMLRSRHEKLMAFFARFSAPIVPRIGLAAAIFFPPTIAFARTVDLGKVLGPAVALSKQLYVDPDGPDRDQKRESLGQLSDQYRALLDGLRPSDTVKFSDGREFKLIDPIGAGAVSSVWKVEGSFALRIPLVNDETLGLTFQLGMARSFSEGWKILKDQTGNVISFYSNPDQIEYALVGYIQDPKNQKAFTFSEFWEALQASNGDMKEFRGYKTSDLIAALTPMAKDLSDVSLIVEGLQMAWSGHAWILFDFSEQVFMFNDPGHRDYATQTVWHGYRWRLEDKVELVTESRGGKEYSYDKITPRFFTPPILKTLIGISMRERKARTCQRILTQIRKRYTNENGSIRTK
jgi:hypothetical protein